MSVLYVVLFHQLFCNPHDQVNERREADEDADGGVDAFEKCGGTGAGGLSHDKGRWTIRDGTVTSCKGVSSGGLTLTSKLIPQLHGR